MTELYVALKSTFQIIEHSHDLKTSLKLAQTRFSLNEINEKSTIGEQIKYYRISLGLTQQQLGQALNVSKNTIMRYENDNIKLFNVNFFNEIIKKLGIGNKLIYNDSYYEFICNNPSQKLKDYREKNKLTRLQVEKMAGLTKGSIKKWERNRAVISRKLYDRIKLLGI